MLHPRNIWAMWHRLHGRLICKSRLGGEPVLEPQVIVIGFIIMRSKVISPKLGETELFGDHRTIVWGQAAPGQLDFKCC